VPDQKFIYILWQSQTLCARQKDDLHSVKLVFCGGTKVFEEALNEVKFLGWLKNLDWHKTFWDLQKDKAKVPPYFCLVLLPVPKHFGLVQMFCAIPETDLHIAPVLNFLCQTER
jgi:hypothetical protein